ncbi:MAG: OmpA family protein [Desulfovibrio sp.]|nr:OmpA family protein [Desulfovibrio sp.]
MHFRLRQVCFGALIGMMATGIVGCADDDPMNQVATGTPQPILADVPTGMLVPADYRPMARLVQLPRAGAAYIQPDIQQVVSTEPPLAVKVSSTPSPEGVIPSSPPVGTTSLQAPPAAEQKFQVFFDFAKATISAAAEQTLRQAMVSALASDVTTISVTGYTDSAGTDQYNLALSVERAKAVRNTLIRLGIPPAEIAIAGEGKTHQLVPTADGVREPQNRRVLILLH